jgi:hypothetical protein
LVKISSIRVWKLKGRKNFALPSCWEVARLGHEPNQDSNTPGNWNECSSVWKLKDRKDFAQSSCREVARLGHEPNQDSNTAGNWNECTVCVQSAILHSNSFT